MNERWSTFSTTCYRADDDEALRGVIGFLQVLEEVACEEEVAKVVDSNAHLKTIGRVSWLNCGWKVDGRVAHQNVERHPGVSEVVDELADALEGCEVEVHDGVAVFGHAGRLCGSLGLEEVAAGHDHVPFPGLGQCLGSV